MEESVLRELLAIGPEDDISEAIASLMSVAADREKNRVENERQAAFAEQYPAEAARLESLEADRRINLAKPFVSQFQHVERDGKRLAVPTAALENLEETYLKFLSGELQHEDLSGMVRGVLESPLAELGERGTSIEDPDAEANEEQMVQSFAEELKELTSGENKLSHGDAIAKITKEHPEWAEAYRSQVPSGSRREG